MKSVSYRIWTRVAVSISYDHNHYTTGTSRRFYITLLKSLNFRNGGIIYEVYISEIPTWDRIKKKLYENMERQRSRL